MYKNTLSWLQCFRRLNGVRHNYLYQFPNRSSTKYDFPFFRATAGSLLGISFPPCWHSAQTWCLLNYIPVSYWTNTSIPQNQTTDTITYTGNAEKLTKSLTHSVHRELLLASETAWCLWQPLVALEPSIFQHNVIKHESWQPYLIPYSDSFRSF